MQDTDRTAETELSLRLPQINLSQTDSNLADFVLFYTKILLKREGKIMVKDVQQNIFYEDDPRYNSHTELERILDILGQNSQNLSIRLFREDDSKEIYIMTIKKEDENIPKPKYRKTKATDDDKKFSYSGVKAVLGELPEITTRAVLVYFNKDGNSAMIQAAAYLKKLKEEGLLSEPSRRGASLLYQLAK